jgi:hypothetical protein
LCWVNKLPVHKVGVLLLYDILVCESDLNNDDVTKVPNTTLGLDFQNTIGTLKDLTTRREVGFSQAVQKIRCAIQNSDKKTGEG